MIARTIQWLEEAYSQFTGLPPNVGRYQELVKNLDNPQSPDYDLVYVLPPAGHQGWILDAICREIDQHCQASTAFCEFKTRLPSASAYFYSHYGFLRDTVLRQPEVLHGKNILFYTHPKKLWYSGAELTYVMNMADRVVSMCSLFLPHLTRQGVQPELLEVALVGADAARFQPSERPVNRIGFCSGYVPRKNGSRILELVQAMPERAFTLCGKKWPDWERFPELNSLPNFEYVDLPYRRYHEFYQSIRVFVSVSELEGGPVPLIEAAMCNVVPVCSNTGHAADIITHGKNGYLFNTSAPIAEVCELIEQATRATFDVRKTVEHLTWKRFSQQIQDIAGLTRSTTRMTTSRQQAA